MNINSAKQQIKKAMTAYFTKDSNGDYIIPIEKQRPIFLMGPPGIGKTAIMEQIASEMGVGLLNYSMTHHTRQSALGLPFIEHKKYGDFECNISEYTMSEILASVYDLMENTGIKEGILFLDEINCVSETLAPIMLQFLQYKIFGKHRLPEGWIVVTAGNPSEYNDSVREFDVVTWDRLKRIDIEPDYECWKEYAYSRKMDASILSYLEIKKADFYKITNTVEGRQFVTARGWEDLNKMLQLYKLYDYQVDEELIGQYIQNKKISKSFAEYYDLFQKYKSDYQIDSILDGNATDEIKLRAKEAGFDERLALIGLILEVINREVSTVIDMENSQQLLIEEIRKFRNLMAEKEDCHVGELISKLIENCKLEIETGKKAGSISHESLVMKKNLIGLLMQIKDRIKGDDRDVALNDIKKIYVEKSTQISESAESVKRKLENAFAFLESVYKEGQELVVMVTELTVNSDTARFIGSYGCDAYLRNNKELKFYERQKEIDREIKELGI